VRWILAVAILDSTPARAEHGFFEPIADATNSIDEELAFRGLGMFAGALTVHTPGSRVWGAMVGVDGESEPKRGVYFVAASDAEIGGTSEGIEGEVRIGIGPGVGGHMFGAPLSLRVVGGAHAGSVGPAGWAGFYGQLAGRTAIDHLIVTGSWMHTRALVDSDSDRFDTRVIFAKQSIFVGGQFTHYDRAGSSLLVYLGTGNF